MKNTREQAGLASLFSLIALLTLAAIIYCNAILPARNAAAIDEILGTRQREIPGSASIVTEALNYAADRWFSAPANVLLGSILGLSLIGAAMASRRRSHSIQSGAGNAGDM